MEKSKPLPQGIYINYFTIPGLKMKRKTTADDIIDQVCRYYDITRELLMSKHRDRPIVHPRQIACYLISEMTPLTTGEISRATGSKVHSTAIHSIGKIKNLMEVYPKTRMEVDYIKDCLIN